MRTLDAAPILHRLVKQRFPSVEDFRVEAMGGNVTPVEYQDGRGHRMNEWPPVAHWRVGGTRFKYVLKPKFIDEHWKITPFFGGTHVRADYGDEDEKLWKLLQWSVEGKSADEMNRLIGNGHQSLDAHV